MLKKLAFAQVLMFLVSGLLAQTTEDIRKFAAKKKKEKRFTSADTTTKTGTVYLGYIPGNASDKVKKGQQAPSWKFVTLSGDSLALDSLKGKVVLLDFFYRACYPCMKAIPDLVKLQEKYKDRGLVIVGIDPVDSAIVPTLADFLARRNVTYPVVISPKAYPRAVYGVQGYPHTFILDRNGRLVEQHVGWSEDMYATWEKTILELLE